MWDHMMQLRIQKLLFIYLPIALQVQMSEDEKESLKLKEEGNQAYKAKKFDEALTVI